MKNVLYYPPSKETHACLKKNSYTPGWMLTECKIKNSYTLILWDGCRLSLPTECSKPMREIKK